HSFLRRVASSSSPAASSGSPVITETALPPRPATWRPTRTRAGAPLAPGDGLSPVRVAGRGRGVFRSTTPRKVCVGFTRVLPVSGDYNPAEPTAVTATRGGVHPEEARLMTPRSRLHVPSPPARPGQEPDFSYLQLSPAGALPRPDVTVAP